MIYMGAKKRLALVLAVLLLALSVVASCGGDDGGGAKEQETATSEDADENVGAEARVMPDLPEADFGGRVFEVLGRFHPVHTQFTNFEIDAEALTGDLVDDAVYTRNRDLEQKYNVKIAQFLHEEPANLLEKLIRAQDDAYSLAFIRAFQAAAMATRGSFYDLKRLKYLDFEKPWWNQNLNSSLTIGGRLFFTTSDFNMVDKNRTYMIIFNRSMADSHGFGNLYDLVYDHKWTLDKMSEFSRAVARDLDGDGAMTPADQWGVGLDDYATFYIFWSTSDNLIITKDSGDYPVLSVNNEHAVNTIDKIFTLTNNKSAAFYSVEFEGKVNYDVAYAARNTFIDGRLLFYTGFTHELKAITQSEITASFGVLPFPKYDEKQKNYISMPNSINGPLFAVPVTVQDTDFSAFMLEALSAASKYEVMPKYYEISVQSKYTDDEDSIKVLDLIFSSIRYDLGDMYDWNGVRTMLMYDIPPTGENSFVSRFERKEGGVLAAMEKTVEAFRELP